MRGNSIRKGIRSTYLHGYRRRTSWQLSPTRCRFVELLSLDAPNVVESALAAPLPGPRTQLVRTDAAHQRQTSVAENNLGRIPRSQFRRCSRLFGPSVDWPMSCHAKPTCDRIAASKVTVTIEYKCPGCYHGTYQFSHWPETRPVRTISCLPLRPGALEERDGRV